MDCPLCFSGKNSLFWKKFHLCDNCQGIFLDLKYYVAPEKEKERYEGHNNDVEDIRYQRFVSPITRYVQNNYTPHHHGLDFGSGTGPVISKILTDSGYRIDQYDPFFNDQSHVLDRCYDYIVSCEVIEHFHHPYEEFKRLKNMLHPGAELICMTHLYSPDIYFPHWYYKNDPTHVFIYQYATIQWIAENFNFRDFMIDNRLIVFKGP